MNRPDVRAEFNVLFNVTPPTNNEDFNLLFSDISFIFYAIFFGISMLDAAG